MARIFLSYSKRDRDLAELVAEALQRAGLSVWWDQEITPRESWDRIIEREIAAADHVLALWTANSVESDWVRIEANYALNCRPRKLVQARFENSPVPIAFSLIQFVDLDRAQPEQGAEWTRLLSWLQADRVVDWVDPGTAAPTARGASREERAAGATLPGSSPAPASPRRELVWLVLLTAVGATLWTGTIAALSLLSQEQLARDEVFAIGGYLSFLLALPYVIYERLEPRRAFYFLLILPIFWVLYAKLTGALVDWEAERSFEGNFLLYLGASVGDGLGAFLLMLLMFKEARRTSILRYMALATIIVGVVTGASQSIGFLIKYQTELRGGALAAVIALSILNVAIGFFVTILVLWRAGREARSLDDASARPAASQRSPASSCG